MAVVMGGNDMFAGGKSAIIALVAAFCVWGGAASALDCPHPGFHVKDTVFKFGTQGSSSALGVIGTVESLGGKAQNAGAVFFDYSSGALKVCNGSSWGTIDVTVSGAGAAGGTFPKDSVWTVSGTSGSVWTVPFDTAGRYTATLEASGTGQCQIDLQRPNNSWMEIATKGSTSYFHAGFMIAKLSGNGFRVAQQYHDAYHPPSGPESQHLYNGSLTGWKGISDMNWNGKMRVRSSSYSCSVNFKIWRLE